MSKKIRSANEPHVVFSNAVLFSHLPDQIHLVRPGEKAKKGAFYLVSPEEMEDFEDSAAIRATAGEETFPLELLQEFENGANPIRVFRKYRNMTMAALAENAGTSQSHISEIETGKKAASLNLTRRIATALDLEVEDLID
jgi:DNA-binding XRE family transcriptional regulator